MDNINMVHRILLANYGARIWPWGFPLAHKGNYCTFQNGPNPGGDDEIWDIFLGEGGTPMDNENRLLILNSTIFGNEIIKKFRLFMVATEISKSKFLALSP